LFGFGLKISLFLTIGIIIIFSVIWSATVYAQLFVPSPGALPAPLTASSPSNTTAATTFVAHGVRITSPANGQQVPTGTLTITGTSKDNPTVDCQVFVIVNAVKPYQNATANGPGGASDYSKWNFNLNSSMIKEGVNKITAKFACRPNPSVASFYSVNVTGTRIGGGTSPSVNTTAP
jgi:Bacterial Ig domain